eukprot:40384-Amphidinium_carterae.2
MPLEVFNPIQSPLVPAVPSSLRKLVRECAAGIVVLANNSSSSVNRFSASVRSSHGHSTW